MHRKHFTLGVCLAVVLLLTGSAFAQDTGVLDTVRYVPESSTWTINSAGDSLFSFEFFGWTDQSITAFSLGFKIPTSTGGGTGHDDSLIVVDTFNYTMSTAFPVDWAFSAVDSASYPGARHSEYNGCLLGRISPFFPPNTSSKIGDFFIKIPDPTLLPCEFDITVDSVFFPPAGVFKFSPSPGSGFAPQYVGATIHVVNNICTPEPTIGLDPTSFTFEAVAGEADPDVQVLSVQNVGEGTLNWTAANTQPWLTLSPNSGVDDEPCSLYVSVAGLAAGLYEDTITVSDPAATNSPQLAVVNFEVIIPPPIIELVPDDFQFLAQQDSANPAPQSMQISDIGAGTLEWTASNSESWLTLSAYGGGPGDVIDLNVDITGMSFGVYYDQIIVSDPNASNSPQIATVELTIVSVFPIIELDPDSFFVVASATQEPYNRQMSITNVGGDWLRYTITSAQGTMSFIPDVDSVISGETATIEIIFNTASLGFGLNYDNIEVSSPTAPNSPQIIPVTIWKMESPPILVVNPDQMTFDVYECYNHPNPPTKLISVQNAGAEFLNWTAYWDASWLILTPSSAENSGTIFTTVDVTGLATGTYVDTVVIVAELSINPPESVEVILNVAEQTDPPIILVTQTHYEFIFKHSQVGTSEQPLTILNTASGCMDWYLTESTTWLDIEPDAGEVPDLAWVGVNGFGLPLGKTSTSFFVNSDEATNSPIEVTVDLYIWTFGDANCDGIVDIDDVVYDLKYIFQGGPEPCPGVWVGDVDCSHTVDIDDVTYLLAYIFQGGPPPCDWDPEPPLTSAVHTFQDEVVK